MKKRFLPFSLLLVIMIFGQSVMADQVGHYVPRTKENSSAAAFISSMRVNQHTGLIDPAWMIAAEKQAASMSTNNKYADVVYWTSMGPDNLGGKTTSIVYNKDNMNEVYVGTMGGGVFYTWNLGISWHQVGENLMVSCLAQAEDGTIYVGTGDGGEAATYNGLSDVSYGNSFVGSGLYKIKNNVMSRIESTVPTTNNDVAEWSFINDVVVVENNVIVATNEGLKYSADCNTWAYAKVGGEDLTGLAIEVKKASDQTVLASVDGMLYIGGFEDGTLVLSSCSNTAAADLTDSTGAIIGIGAAGELLDIAVAPSDPNVIYAAAVGTNGNHSKFYISENKGQTWRVILPSVTNNLGHQIYEEKGAFYHGLVVNPADPYSLFVTGYNIWRLDRPANDVNGYYLALQISSASTVHVGINALAFDPRNAQKAYVATDGGIFKAEPEGSYFSFVDCNRGNVTTRCFNIAPSNKGTRVIAGLLDQGPILIEGKEGTNNMGTADLLNPPTGLTPAHYGAFDESQSAGFCAVSLIDPNAMFMTLKDGAIYRSESAGQDYDEANFTANQTFSFTGYRMPMALWETFNDEYSVDSIKFQCLHDMYAGETVQCFSANGGYPVEYVLPVDLHTNPNNPLLNDSINVPDPITTKLFVVAKESTSYTVYYTRDALKFNTESVWYKVATGISGYPTCIAVSADGDVVLVGTADGTLARVSNLRAAVDDSTSTSTSTQFVVESTELTLPVSGQCVTSVSFYTDDANKVVVTLGNYGNDAYVLYSDDVLSVDPTFVAKQGNLPKMPVYSSVYTSTYDGAAEGHVLIGTEHGIYRTTDITASSPVWVAENDNMGDVPVMEMKQQIVKKDVQYATIMVDTVATSVAYPGTDNEGTIYAATYGRGLFRCETYRQSSFGVQDNPTAVASKQVSMYPNPVSGDEARISFELNHETAVSYQVFDITGRMVRNEVIGTLSEGKHEASVSVSGLANGSYILRLNAGNQTSTAKFMVF
jgi:hypothetical protein